MSERWWGLRRWSRHSLVLTVAGLYYISIGWSFRAYVPGSPRWNALVIARSWMSFEMWSMVFILVGCIAIWSAIWPRRTEVWGYSILTGISSLWCGFYSVGILVADTSKSNLSIAFTWGLVAFLWWAISGLLSPTSPAAVIDGCS